MVDETPCTNSAYMFVGKRSTYVNTRAGCEFYDSQLKHDFAIRAEFIANKLWCLGLIAHPLYTFLLEDELDRDRLQRLAYWAVLFGNRCCRLKTCGIQTRNIATHV